jgi:serine/threonine protein phosphatase 1
MTMTEQTLTAPNQRIYAIGDVHGRLDLLVELIGRIRKDSAHRGRADTTIVQLGNLVGGGDCSAELVRKFMNFTCRSERVVVLQGRHEAMMAQSLAGNPMMFGLWLLTGGDAMLAGWGVDKGLIASKDLPRILDAARTAVSSEVLEWLGALPLSYRSGDYLFVPGGTPPGRQIHRRDKHLLSINTALIRTEHERDRLAALKHGPVTGRTPLLDDSARHLIALGLEGAQRWTLRAGPDPIRPREVAGTRPAEPAYAAR